MFSPPAKTANLVQLQNSTKRSLPRLTFPLTFSSCAIIRYNFLSGKSIGEL